VHHDTKDGHKPFLGFVPPPGFVPPKYYEAKGLGTRPPASPLRAAQVGEEEESNSTMVVLLAIIVGLLVISLLTVIYLIVRYMNKKSMPPVRERRESSEMATMADVPPMPVTGMPVTGMPVPDAAESTDQSVIGMVQHTRGLVMGQVPKAVAEYDDLDDELGKPLHGRYDATDLTSEKFDKLTHTIDGDFQVICPKGTTPPRLSPLDNPREGSSSSSLFSASSTVASVASRLETAEEEEQQPNKM